MRAWAERQAGRIASYQLEHLGVPHGTLSGWKRTGDLTLVAPRVYAFGYDAAGILGELWTAILYAGPGAMLSHMSAAWWRDLIEFPPPKPHVSSPRDVRSRPGTVVHRRRELPRTMHKGLPVTSIPQTMLDLASTKQTRLVRKALGRLEFNHQFDLEALRAITEHGRAGSALLNRCLDIHDRRFAQTNGALEEEFFLMWEARDGLPYEVDAWVLGIECDCWWPQQRVIVQLDGDDNHGSKRQRARDRADDLTLRSGGNTVLRYGWDDVNDTPDRVYADVNRALGD